jgi:sulfur carrier protein
MNLKINGDPRTVPAGTLGALVQHLGMRGDRVAIELNREIVPRDRWNEVRLNEGDELEIVHFVGGGCESRPERLSAGRNYDVEVFG